MPKNSKTLYKEFSEKITALNIIRTSFETAFNSGNISATEITQAYAGLYLDVFTQFENLIESLFYDLLVGNIKHNNTSVVRKVRFLPNSYAEEILLAGDKYIKWLPLDITIKRAHTYFNDGKPFSFLNSSETSELLNYIKIRNAISHKSKNALTSFNTILGSLILLPIERTPNGYLRYRPTGMAGITQFEIISNRLVDFARILCY